MSKLFRTVKLFVCVLTILGDLPGSAAATPLEPEGSVSDPRPVDPMTFGLAQLTEMRIGRGSRPKDCEKVVSERCSITAPGRRGRGVERTLASWIARVLPRSSNATASEGTCVCGAPGAGGAWRARPSLDLICIAYICDTRAACSCVRALSRCSSAFA